MVFKTIGHNRLKKFFSKIILHNNFSPVYLFIGEEGVGKSTLAWDIVRLFFDDERVDKIIHPDFIVVSNNDFGIKNELNFLHPRSFPFCRTKLIKADTIRKLQETIIFPPHETKKRFILILDADLIREDIQNLLLKTLEEPREYNVFILVSSRIFGVLPTIISRSVIIKFSSLSLDEFSSFPFEKYFSNLKIDLKLLYNISYGSIGRALRILYYDLLKLRNSIVEILRGNLEKMEELLNEEWDIEKLKDFLWIYLVLLKDILFAKKDLVLKNYDLESDLKYISKFKNTWDLIDQIEYIGKLEKELVYSPDPLKVILNLFSKWGYSLLPNKIG